MGGQISCIHPNYHVDNQSRNAAQTVKLIRSDGMVKVYHRPVEAAELMLEFPKHLVCHADSFFIGQKVPPLSEKDRLQLGNKYFLLPQQFFQSVLSFVTIASFVLVDDNSDTASSKKKEFVKKLAATCKPFDILKSASGNLQIRVSDEFITKLMEEGRLREGGEDQGEEDNRSCNDQVCTTPQLKKDYSQLVGFRRSVQWRPKLDTIREKKDRKKIGGFGIKKKKMKTQAKIDQQRTRKLEKEKEKKEKKMEKKEKREKKKEQKNEKKKERKEKKEKEKEEKEIRKKEKEKPASKAPPPPPPLPPPPPPPIRSSSLKIRWKKKKL